MENQGSNIFVISTPSQMLNAVEFINHFNLRGQENVIIITCNSKLFIQQIKTIGNSFSLGYHVLFSPNHALFSPVLFNKMPLKLVRLFFSKKRIDKLLKSMSVNQLILGNYSNFLCQYCTQKVKTKIYVLDDGTGSILVGKKRIGELKDGIPIFDYNYKKKALWLVKLLMGFYKYKIPSKLTFFSSYDLNISGQDVYVSNSYNYLVKLYRNQKIDNNLEYFIGSPISEVGYITQEHEVGLILHYAKHVTSNKLIYIPHRLDSNAKLNKIQKSIDIINFDLPIEFALSQKIKLPKRVSGFFTSALPNLAKLMPDDILLFALYIPNQIFLTENMKNRAASVYSTYEEVEKINVTKCCGVESEI